MSAQPFLGEIVPFASNFAPRGYALCDGQLLPIAQNTALFALLGIQYGGNGTTNFALPDLRGRHGIHTGQGPGLANHPIGEHGGAQAVTLTADQVPSHIHTVPASSAAASSSDPSGKYWADGSGSEAYGPVPNPDSKTNAMTAMSAGLLEPDASSPHDNMAPFLALTFIIATQGIFPSRN